MGSYGRHAANISMLCVGAGAPMRKRNVQSELVVTILVGVSFLLPAGFSSSAEAHTSPVTYCGKLWNIWKVEQGETWIEIGHGLEQCSIKNVASEAAKKILSVTASAVIPSFLVGR